MAAYVGKERPEPSDPAPGIQLAIFGGLRLWRNGHEAAIGSRRQRIVLAELICAAGNVVGLTTLVDALWGQDPAASAVNQVHRIVGQLRRTLEPGLSPHSAGTTILKAGVGYRLVTERVQCDLFQMRNLTHEARILLAGGKRQAAGERYGRALQLARGALFGGLHSEVETRPEFLAIEQERVATAVAAVDLAITDGGDSELLAVVAIIAASSPLNEPLHARLIRLLNASGRRADALSAFDAIRCRLADGLGVDPGQELNETYRELLVADSADGPRGTPATSVPRPAQLPRALPGFVRRSEAEALLGQRLIDNGETVVITAFGGMGGIGKTALAVHWAHRLADQFPDGQLYLNLRGFDPEHRAMDPSDAVNALLEGLGQSLVGMKDADLDTRTGRYRTLMADRRMIVVLDNARDSAQVRPLLPGAARCLVLITSRNTMTGLVAQENARYIPLGRLTPVEARELLINRLGARRVSSENDTIARLIDRCAGLPLALSIVAARIATSAALPLDRLVGRLFDRSLGLSAFSVGEGRDDVRSVFSWSYEQLSAGAADLFRALGAHPGPDFSLASIAALIGRDNNGTRQIVSELIGAHLLSESTTERYVIHDLLRLYARELLTEAGDLAGAESRLLDHYLSATRSAYSVYGRDPIAELQLEDPHATVSPCRDVNEAIAWYAAERASVAAAAELALATGHPRSAALLVLDSRPMSQVQELKSTALPLCLRILDATASELLESHFTEAHLIAELHRDVAGRYTAMEGPEAAAGIAYHFEKAMTLSRQINDLAGQSNIYRMQSMTAGRLSQFANAAELSAEALRLARQAERPDLVAATLVNHADILTLGGRYEEAMAIATEALTAIRQQGQAYLEPNMGFTVALAALKVGDPAKALAAAQSAIEALLEAPEPAMKLNILAIAALAAAQTLDFLLSARYVKQHADACADLGPEVLMSMIGPMNLTRNHEQITRATELNAQSRVRPAREDAHHHASALPTSRWNEERSETHRPLTTSEGTRRSEGSS